MKKPSQNHVCVCVCVCVYIYIYICVCVCVCVCTHTLKVVEKQKVKAKGDRVLINQRWTRFGFGTVQYQANLIEE